MVKTQHKKITLVGLMGSGKSTLGKFMYEKYGLRFVDSDEVIVGLTGASINEIFKDAGEAKFRELEYQVICDLMNSENDIIATGGGAYIQENTRTAIENGAKSVFLYTSIEELYKRLEGDKTRPLLKDNKLEDLVEDRYKIYEQAQFKIDTDDGDIERCAEELFKIWNN